MCSLFSYGPNRVECHQQHAHSTRVKRSADDDMNFELSRTAKCSTVKDRVGKGSMFAVGAWPEQRGDHFPPFHPHCIAGIGLDLA